MSSRLVGGLAAAFLIVAVAAGMPTSDSTTSAVLAQAATPAPEGPLPCDPSGNREVEPRVVEEGGEVEVTVNFNFNCTGEDRRINFFLVVENTSFLGGPRNAALTNVRQGLLQFVNAVNYANGSQGGLTLYAEDYTNRVILRGGADGKQELLNQIGRISVQPIGDAAGQGGAIRDATGRLPTGVDTQGATNVLVVVDGGAPQVTPPLVTLGTACGAARDAGVHVIMVGLAPAQNRSAFCATPGWFRLSGQADARDFPGIMDGLARDLLRGLRASNHEYVDFVRSSMTYVSGSGQPRDPQVVPPGDLSWTFNAGNPPPGGQQIRYKLRVPEEGRSLKMRPSVAARLMLFFPGEAPKGLELPNPEICIYAPGEESFCANYPPTTPTPTDPAQPTEEPTETPTLPAPTPGVDPTESPTVPPVESPPPPTAQGRAYLPVAMARGSLGRR